MPLRRLWAGGPLALFVAILAHVAGFGRAHAPGAEHAGELLVVLAIALAVLAAAVLLRSLARAMGARNRAAGSPTTMPSTPRALAGYVAALAALAGLAFAALEFVEGHLVTSGSLRSALALLPVAAIVAVIANRAGRTLDDIGSRIGAALAACAHDIVTAFAPRAVVRLRIGVARRGGALRGRAPPRIA